MSYSISDSYFSDPRTQPNLEHKNFYLHQRSADKDGNYKSTTGGYDFKYNDIDFQGIDINGIYHSGGLDDLILQTLPRLQDLAQLNPRFNRYINPMYYIGIDPVGTNSFLDNYKNKDDDSDLGNKESVNISHISLLNSPVRDQLSEYKIRNDERKTPKNYEQLFVNPSVKNPKAYLDSLVSYGKGRLHNLLSIANKSINDFLPDSLKNLNSAVNYFTNADFLGLKDTFVNQVQTNVLASDSEDPFYGAKFGLSIGQSTGKVFRHVLGGFSNSVPLDTFQHQLQKEALKITIDDPFTNTHDTAMHYHFEYMDPSIYSVDERIKFGTQIKRDDRLTILQSLFSSNEFIGFVSSDLSNLNVADVVKKADDILSGNGNIGGDVGKFLLQQSGNDSTSLTNSFLNNFKGTKTGDILSQKFATFTKTLLPNELSGNGDTQEGMRDLFLAGKASKYGMLFAQENHKQYINTHPIGVLAKWWTIDNDVIFNEDLNFFDDLAIETQISGKYPHLKPDREEKIIIEVKQSAIKDNLIYEGVQQNDGGYEGVTYSDNKQQPQSARADLNDGTYLSHVKDKRINQVLGEPDKGTKIDYSKNPELGWANEPQFFPFYFRSLREDYAMDQQSFYNNGGVFMSKRRMTGNSIVFLEAAIPSVQEGFQSQINQEQYLGRVEPLLSYVFTTRSFSITFDIIASHPKDVPSIRAKVNSLIQMQYPQVMALNDLGVIGYRKTPMVEFRIGDMWFLHGVITSLTPDWGGDQKIWEIIPGGRNYKCCRVQMSMNIIHTQQPNAGFDFYSPTFNPKVFYPNHIDKSTQSASNNSNEQGALQDINNSINNVVTTGQNAIDQIKKDLGGFNINQFQNNIPSFP